jgi:hypothetical protein
MLSGWYASNFTEGDLNYQMLAVLEETLEISGSIMFIFTLFQYLHATNNRTVARENDSQID